VKIKLCIIIYVLYTSDVSILNDAYIYICIYVCECVYIYIYIYIYIRRNIYVLSCVRNSVEV